MSASRKHSEAHITDQPTPTDGPRVRVHNFSISLDGFGTGVGLSFDEPFGHAGHRLTSGAGCGQGRGIASFVGPYAIDETATDLTSSIGLSPGERTGTLDQPTRAVVSRHGCLENAQHPFGTIGGPAREDPSVGNAQALGRSHVWMLRTVHRRSLPAADHCQPAALATSARSFFFTASFTSMTAKTVGHITPSSSWASSWKPTVP